MTAQPVQAQQDSSLATFAALEALTGRTRKLLGAYTLGKIMWDIGKSNWRKAQQAATYQVAMLASDDLYTDLHRWLLTQLPPRRQRSVVARTRRGNEPQEINPTGKTDALRVRLLFDGTKAETVTIGGHPVRVELERSVPGRFNEDQPRWALDLERILLTARSEAGRDAILTLLDELAAQRDRNPPRLYVASRWGDWSRRGESPVRPLSSVVLRAGQSEGIVADLQRFLATEADYSRLGVPWHRGYLFSGPPGTGKTSMARALSGEFGLDVYYVPLPSLPNDSTLIQLLGGVEPRSMLLLEDVDVVHGARVRDDTDPGVTLSGLLNALDGLVTPHGMISVMTTNNAAVLDPALLRPGRVDRSEEFRVASGEHVERLFSVLMGVPGMTVPDDVSVHPAEFVETVIQGMSDPDHVMAQLGSNGSGVLT